MLEILYLSAQFRISKGARKSRWRIEITIIANCGDNQTADSAKEEKAELSRSSRHAFKK